MTRLLEQPDVFYTQLLTLSREAFDAEKYEVSYHLLAALSHFAIGSSQHLHEIEAEVERQKQYIDRVQKEHPLSSQSAGSHGHKNIFDSLTSQIHSHLLIAQSQKQIDHIKEH